MSDVTQGPYVFSLWTVLSEDRLRGYGRPGEPCRETLAKYLWNMSVCEALYPSLQALEIALRIEALDRFDAVYATGLGPFRDVVASLGVPGVTPLLRQASPLAVQSATSP